MCKPCNTASTKQWRRDNPETVRQNLLRYRAEKAEAIKASRKVYHQTAAFKERIRKWRRDNPGKVNAHTAKRYALKRRAAPPWLTFSDLDYMRAVYIAAAALGMQVDHIVPIVHPLVCGLHVPWNLQMLTPTENQRKNNKFEIE